MKKTFPSYGIIGIILLIVSEIFLFKKVEPFYSWFYSFAWWSTILFIDAIIYRLKGNSLIHSRTKEFFIMIPWSIFIWSIFEGANLWLKNWYYINLPHSIVERWLGYAVAYGTVLPALFETSELLEVLGLLKDSKTKKIVISSSNHKGLILLGALWLLLPLLIPFYFFPLIWLGFIFLLEPLNYRFGARSLLRDLEEGNPRQIYLLLIAGLICGGLWEFWNYWAASKWIYTVPFFETAKGFEMPCLGFLGFPPFAIEAYVMYNTLSLFRFRRGWEQASYRLNLESRTGRTSIVLTTILIISFSVLVFRAIDINTVDSYAPRLSDAYWISPHYREQLPKAGIASLDDLISKTRDRNERDELALRLLVPREDLLDWVERAQLATLKGLGIENLRLLEKVDIHSVSALSAETPGNLEEKMEQIIGEASVPGLSKLRIWIREARRAMKGEQ
jgi:hypothetical protein